MRVISCSLENFASYKSLEFSFENQGLTLIQGSTGSGKSTLCDAISWVLFGRTAKDGAVDEVLSWSASGPTKGTIILTDSAASSAFSIMRIRGEKANDLYFDTGPASAKMQRGKDINDTQKQINNLLGVTVDAYLAGAYYHEFSQTAQFFTTTAKNRRSICEQLVDLSLPKTLQNRLSEQSKVLNKQEQAYDRDIRLFGDRLERLPKTADLKAKANTFAVDKKKSLDSLNNKIDALVNTVKSDDYFKAIKQDLLASRHDLGSGTCGECGAKKHSAEHTKIEVKLAELAQEIRLNEQQKSLLKDLIKQLDTEIATENTYAALAKENEIQTADLTIKLDLTVLKHTENATGISDLETLLEVTADLRSVTIKNTISRLESQTNKLLEDYFDSEIKVTFEVEAADKLDVTILKDGNLCAYTQLSKGQRQLLKLCFGVSVMRQVANHNGVSFNCAFLDEALDGMDDALKIKTYRLLQELSKDFESLFVVDHSESLKAMFSNKYSVELINGESRIEKSSGN